MATFTNRIKDLIGNDYTTIASLSASDLFNAAVSEIADLLSPELLLKYAVAPIVINNSTPTWNHASSIAGPEGTKVLLVTMAVESGGSGTQGGQYPCREVSVVNYGIALDAGSIYYATVHSPIYSLVTQADGFTDLLIFPIPTATYHGKIYYFKYPTTDITSASTIAGFPNELEQAVVLKACIHILKTYISNQVQDEEDIEILQMLGVQMGALEKDYMAEIQRYLPQDTKPRGE